MEIQFEHEHVLTFCDKNKENFFQILLKFLKRDERNRRKIDGDDAALYVVIDYPKCRVCFRIVDDGPVYFCEMCDGIWVHKSCASLPREIQAHPLHSLHDHPLTLQTGEFCNFNYEDSICDGCREVIPISSYYYECTECGLKVDCKCAVLLDKDYPQQITTSLSPNTKKISHDSHRHKLFLFNSGRELSLRYNCMLCGWELVDLTYGCLYCGFYLHKGCAEISQQECELQHPCHSRHPVSIGYGREKFICDQCRDLCSGIFMGICKECGFKIDFKCAFLSDTANGMIQRSIGNEVKAQIRYFNHDLHLLSFFNCTSDFDLKCKGCRLPLSGPGYGCLECSLYLHKSCAELPRIIQHPYHPSHNLYLQPSDIYGCRACRRYTGGLSYRCYWCPSFSFHSQCAINNLGVISALKNKEYHQHDLFYFVAPDWLYDSQCNICSQNCEGSFYICLECYNSHFHVKCIGIPTEVKHDCHIHRLTLMDPLTKDDINESKEYYCYACENKRNPRYHAYSCQQCVTKGHIFTAHIECIASTELNEIEHNHMIKEDEEEDSHEKYPDLCNLSISPRCMKQLLIKDKFNDHVLKYFEDITDLSCYLCKELVQSPGFECSFCQIHLHKQCAELPSKIKHNLHEHTLSIRGGEFLKRFICDGCHVYHKNDMCYYCEECNFFLDRMCAQAIPSIGIHYQKLNDDGSKVGFSHFSHNHKLRFSIIPEKLQVSCSVCYFLFSGPTYCCYACDFFLHKSCFDELEPHYIQHPFHIQHPLHFIINIDVCKVCRSRSDIGYKCEECDFWLDAKCVKYLTSGLQHKCHEHNLFYFVANIFHYYDYDNCKECGKICDVSFYRCLECNINIHIECIPIPQNVKSICHVHPLTLKNSIAEEGREEYYCDGCESLRNPKHAVYCCEKCHYTAHIGCVLDEEDGELEILESR